MRILVSLFSAVLAIPCFGQTFPQPGRHEAVSSSPEARAQITLQNKAQVSKVQVAKVNRLKLLRSTIAR